MIYSAGSLILAISVIVLLVVLVFVFYILNRKTPLPKGCEDVKTNDAKCASCQNEDCAIKSRMKE